MTQPSDILFQVVSNLTGGIVSDLTTAMIAMVTIALILMGLDYLKDVFESGIRRRSEANHIQAAHENLGMAAAYGKGTDEENDVLEAVYKKRARYHINEAARIR